MPVRRPHVGGPLPRRGTPATQPGNRRCATRQKTQRLAAWCPALELRPPTLSRRHQHPPAGRPQRRRRHFLLFLQLRARFLRRLARHPEANCRHPRCAHAHVRTGARDPPPPHPSSSEGNEHPPPTSPRRLPPPHPSPTPPLRVWTSDFGTRDPRPAPHPPHAPRPVYTAKTAGLPRCRSPPAPRHLVLAPRSLRVPPLLLGRRARRRRSCHRPLPRARPQTLGPPPHPTMVELSQDQRAQPAGTAATPLLVRA